ncbi:SDR family NAD(P)-dependent oxidoreductase [Leptospira meyeri]|uniref:SDR family NAD(P)-dependent oxidoreductase n=1 Tax=Leptospira meyeri TaxID=29508 RepID=UPI0010845301|nr:SDR family oxidoreductase [Leptospira meyeri]MCW7490403.1 SDR family oxidoreductase [Leptospira meyeri]TGM62099.1 SDR family oxidoreductase [Leptospira meyeri]
MSSFQLKNSVVVITGASGHLGYIISKAFIEEGSIVVVVGRDFERLKDRFKSYESNFFKSVYPYACDIQKEEHLDLLVTFIREKFRKVNVLINNAYSGESIRWFDVKKSDFFKSYDIAVVSPFMLIQKLYPLFEIEKIGHSSIINISSMYGQVSPDPSIYGELIPNSIFYGVAKAGLIQLSKYLAVTFAEKGIRVNSISPGPFPSNSVLIEQPDFIKKLSSKVPMKRIGKPEELVGTVLLLASPLSSYITGENISVDGGWTAW